MDSPKARKEIGEKLKQARVKKKLTQAQVADKAGISANYYATVERGEENISTENLLRIIEVLGIKSSDVLPI